MDGTRHGHPARARRDVGRAARAVVGQPCCLVLLLLLPIPLVWAWRRRRETFALIVTLELNLLAIPLIVEMARWKRNIPPAPRALFPAAGDRILTAIALLAIVRTAAGGSWIRLDGRDAHAIASGRRVRDRARAAAAGHRGVRRRPERFFARSKRTRDVARRRAERARRHLEAYRTARQVPARGAAQRDGQRRSAQYLRWCSSPGDRRLRGRRTTPAHRRARCRVVADGCLGERGPVVDRRASASRDRSACAPDFPEAARPAAADRLPGDVRDHGPRLGAAARPGRPAGSRTRSSSAAQPVPAVLGYFAEQP